MKRPENGLSHRLDLSLWHIILIILVTSIFLVTTTKDISAQEETPLSDQGSNSQDVLAIDSNLAFNSDADKLSLRNSADESFWFEIENQRILILKHRSTSQVLHGDVILLHAQGEQSDHPRMIRPLALQMKSLGWQVYIPLLPIEDFPPDAPQELPSSVDTSISTPSNPVPSPETDASVTEPANENINTKTHFFKNKIQYQTFFDQIIDKLIAEIQPKTKNMVVIANQNSGFWILNLTKSANSMTQLVLISPQVPKNVQEKIDVKFSAQTLPLFAFIEDQRTSEEFNDAFSRNLWLSKTIRLDQSGNLNEKIPIENIRMAKQISGWVRSQNNDQ